MALRYSDYLAMGRLTMMGRRSGHWRQRGTVFFSLLFFLFSGIGVVQSLPIFFMVIGNAHPMFITQSHGKIHLVLHHRGNQDEHEETSAHSAHQHDLLDKVIAVSRNGVFSHTDHEVEIPAFEEKTATKANKFHMTKGLTSFLAAQVSTVSLKPDRSHFTPHSPPTTNPAIGSLRKTILLI